MGVDEAAAARAAGLLLIDASGRVSISDYKSGFVARGEDNHVPPHAETQLQLYLLMAEELTGREATARVEGAGSVEIPWGPSERERTRARIAAMDARFPAGSSIPAEDAAAPGSHCRGCRLRPRCTAYLSRAPAFWPNTGLHPRPLPLDVWGSVREVELEDAGYRIRVADPAGRLALVEGVDMASSFQPDSTIYFFDLESTEDVVSHGRRMHPTSFHQHSPGPRWKDALRTRAFIGT